MKRLLTSLSIVLAVAILAGCSSLSKPGFPKRSYDEQKQLKDLTTAFEKPGMIADYYTLTNAPDATDAQKADLEIRKRSARDEIVNGRLALIDLNYSHFVSQFSFTKQSLDAGTEVVELGLNLATTAVGGAATKTVLGAVAAGVTGSKLAIDKNFFYEKTVPVLVTSMNAQRKTALVTILTGMTNAVDQYPLARALSDLENYYFAGTFIGALQAIQSDSGHKEKLAETDIQKIRKFSFVEDKASKLLTAFLWPQGMTNADGTDKDVNDENLKTLRTWMKKETLDTIPIAVFLHNPFFEEARKKSAKELNLTK